MTLLTGKVAVVHGAGGAIGGAVSQAFARHGAQVYLSGRTLATVEATASKIGEAGFRALSARVDALDEVEVQTYLDSVVAVAGRLDISFNAVGLEDEQGTALVDMTLSEVAHPVQRAVNTHFLTATTAARHMMKEGSGVIMAITAEVPSPNLGGFGIACAATELFCRQLALEVGPQGVRVVCLRSSGSPDAPGVDEVFHEHARNAGLTRAEFEMRISRNLALRRMPRLAEIGNAAVLAASDLASSMTASVLDVTCGGAGA